MTDLSEKLSAYLDGELSDDDALEVEAWLERDPEAQEQLETLMQVDTLARDAFDVQLKDPVPLAVAQTIKTTPKPQAPASRRPVWSLIAAGLALFMIGGAGGYLIKGQTASVKTAGWLQDIASYHAVYAAQNRHLVEVSADESEHIETWLGNTVGASFTIPDLSEHGLTFEGGRLLVANGAPVAQLMYRNSDGQVIALCLQRNNTGAQGNGFRRQLINDFEFVSWSSDQARYVVIGPQAAPNLDDIAKTAAFKI